MSCAYGNRFPFFFGVVLLFLCGGLMTSGTRIHLHKRRRAYNVYIGLIFSRENIERNSQRHITHNNAQTHIHILWLNLFFSSVAPTRCTPPLFFFSLDAADWWTCCVRMLDGAFAHILSMDASNGFLWDDQHHQQLTYINIGSPYVWLLLW